MRGLGDLDLQLGIRDVEPVARLALEPDRDLVAVPGLDVPVHAVVGHVQLPAHEPLREWRPDQSSTSVNGSAHDRWPACSAQNPSRSAAARSYMSGWAFACAANSALGGNTRSSCERLDRASLDGFCWSRAK